MFGRMHQREGPAAADAMDGSAAARHVRSRGPKPRYSPSAEDQRPQLGGELGPDLLQRQVDKVAANEGDCFFELSLAVAAEVLAAADTADSAEAAAVLAAVDTADSAKAAVDTTDSAVVRNDDFSFPEG